MLILDLIALLVFTYGAFVFSAMLVAWATSARHGPWQSADTVGIVIGVLSTVWFVFHAASTVWPDGAWTASERLLAISLSVTMTYAYPPLIMHVTWVQLDPARRGSLPAAIRGALPAMYVAAGVAVVVTVAGLWRLVGLPWLTQGVVQGIVAAMFITCALWSAFVSTRAGRAHESPMHAQSQRVYAVLFLGMAVAFVLMLLAWQTLLIGRAVEILVKSLPLVFVFAGTWVEDRLAFYDIFLKRGLTLCATLFLLTGWLALALPWLDVLGVGWWRPWAFALAMLPAVMILRAVARRGEAWLDRAWFGRPVSTFDAIAHVLDAADGARDEGDLRSRLAGAFSEAVNMPVRIDAGPADGDPAGGGAFEGDPATAGGLRVSIDGGSGHACRVTVGAGEASRALLSEDMARVRMLARVAGPLVRAMRAQQAARDQESHTQQLALEARRAELRALRAQIDPHFLFNALNAVAGLVHVDAERADRAVEALAEVFRYTLRASEREWARLDDELAFAQAYLDVERARFGEARLAVSVRCDQVARAVLVPALVVQTLVENAIKHGVSQVRGLARVDVDSWIDGNDVVVTVVNDGPPPPGDVLSALDGSGVPGRGVPGGGHGLGNIGARLAGYFGDAATFTLTRDAQTRATLRIPRVWDHASRGAAAGSGAPAPGPA